jgi:hypothetical protein
MSPGSPRAMSWTSFAASFGKFGAPEYRRSGDEG